MKRYEVRWAVLDPTVGSEMAKQRPVVIVSRDELNARLETITVCPLTSQLHPAWRTRLACHVARKDAEIAVDHIRSFDETLTKAQASKRIEELQERTGRGVDH